ncbi:hypothetical protein ES703_118009 [subsurface metagenome]
MFFKKNKKPLNSEEYEKLSKRITDVEAFLVKLESKFMSLRGLIHRKFTGDVEGAEKEEKETSKSIDGLDSLRKANQ